MISIEAQEADRLIALRAQALEALVSTAINQDIDNETKLDYIEFQGGLITELNNIIVSYLILQQHK